MTGGRPTGVSASPIVEVRGADKAFSGNYVLEAVDLTLHSGRIHALLGENGAGKSTLINLVSGALQPDGGAVFIDGRETGRLTPPRARDAGIAVVQQELSLTSTLSIAENIGAGAFPRRFGVIDYAALRRRGEEVCGLVGLDAPLDRPVGDLPLGQRQMIEIAKALFRRPRILILDEPTSSLSAHETSVLFTLMQRLREEGLALLFISHRLHEVQALCDHVTVLKDGRVTADRPVEGLTEDELVRLMVGREAGVLFPDWAPAPGKEELVRVEGFSAGGARDVSLTARRGEVAGLGGLVGQGQEDFLLGLYGAIPAGARSARIADRDGVMPDIAAANAAGIVYVPADRKSEGLVLQHSIASNLALPSVGRLAGRLLRDFGGERATVESLCDRLTIRGDVERPVLALSGGNQQKVSLAKWLPLAPSVLLLNDPTRGVDIETKREIYLMLRRFAAEGSLVILLSSDTPELVHLCDSVSVFREGRVVATLAHAEITEEAIVGAAMGAETAAGDPARKLAGAGA